jgi:hypothetical protein
VPCSWSVSSPGTHLLGDDAPAVVAVADLLNRRHRAAPGTFSFPSLKEIYLQLEDRTCEDDGVQHLQIDTGAVQPLTPVPRMPHFPAMRQANPDGRIEQGKIDSGRHIVDRECRLPVQPRKSSASCRRNRVRATAAGIGAAMPEVSSFCIVQNLAGCMIRQG